MDLITLLGWIILAIMFGTGLVVSVFVLIYIAKEIMLGD